MLPVLTRPLGSRNDILDSSPPPLIEKKLSASARDPVWELEKPLVRVWALSGILFALVVVGRASVLTRSAQDLGAVFAGGDVRLPVTSNFPERPSLSSWPVVSIAFLTSGFFESEGCSVLFVSEVTLTEARLDGLEAKGILGIAGRIGPLTTLARSDDLTV